MSCNPEHDYKLLISNYLWRIVMTLAKVVDVSPNLGCDPEFFFTRKGKVIGSELVLPEEGLKDGMLINKPDRRQKIIRDGVQAELNPFPSTCRDSVSSHLVTLFRKIDGELIKKDPKKTLGVAFNQLVRVPAHNMRKLSEKSRSFGCSPSSSIYGESIDIAAINTDKYMYRAAGGHIHLGYGTYEKTSGLYRALKTDVERTVLMLDIICGNTLVLIDRDKGNIERRKVYGRAGEYRTPEHGLEYRTPSNFWLHCKPLLSLAFGLARLAVTLMADDNREAYFKAFTEAVNVANIQKAINENNYNLAMKNFKAIEPLLCEVLEDSGMYGKYPINKNNMHAFYFFVEMVKLKGISFWFPENPMEHWIKGGAGPMYKGFNDFLRTDVQNILNTAKKTSTS